LKFHLSPAERGTGGTKPVDRDSGIARLLPLVVPVAAGGAAVLGAALADLASSPPDRVWLLGAAALLAAALLAEAFPVPVASLPAGYVSLAAVFVVGSAVVHGWEAAVLVAFFTRAVLEIVQRRPAIRLLFNACAYALAGAAAGAAAGAVPETSSVGALFLEVICAAASFYVVNIVLVAAVIARWAGEPFLGVLRRSVVYTAAPFAIMASASLMLAVLWERSPLLAAALLGPLLAIALYQRSVHNALVATRLALTDSLTGLGNQRHFHERLEQELNSARAQSRPLTLCLVDVDDMKHINDTYGHPAGDIVLERVAGCLRRGGEAFRVGGDEFALLLPGRDARAGLEVAEAVMRRLGRLEAMPDVPLRVSAGVATYPTHCSDRSELYRLTDQAMYRAKREGKGLVNAYGPDCPSQLSAAG
jgi:diguanylate cyclase (GGDEF)-like protein